MCPYIWHVSIKSNILELFKFLNVEGRKISFYHTWWILMNRESKMRKYIIKKDYDKICRSFWKNNFNDPSWLWIGDHCLPGCAIDLEHGKKLWGAIQPNRPRLCSGIYKDDRYTLLQYPVDDRDRANHQDLLPQSYHQGQGHFDRVPDSCKP